MSSRPSRYVRFVTDLIDEGSGHRRGVFQAVSDALADIETSNDHWQVLRSTYDWFNAHMKAPDRFSRSKRVNAAAKAISWFKSDANEHITHMRRFCEVLNACGIGTEMITTDRPGYLVYEDAHQIAAIPFNETRT